MTLEVECQSNAEHRGWLWSPDGPGVGPSTVMIYPNISSPKYTVNGANLRINNANASDEGLYRCVYDNGASKELCVYVYGK